MSRSLCSERRIDHKGRLRHVSRQENSRAAACISANRGRPFRYPRLIWLLRKARKGYITGWAWPLSRRGRRFRHLADSVGVASWCCRRAIAGGGTTEVNCGYRDHFNCSFVVIRRRRGTLLGDGRRMGNRTHRINYCRSCDRVSLEWLSRKTGPAPLILVATVGTSQMTVIFPTR